MEKVKKKYSIQYKKNGRMTRRMTKYYGVMTEKPMLTNYSLSSQFFSDKICKCCHGKKYSMKHENYKVANLSIGDFMTMPFYQLQSYMEKIISDINDINLNFAINNIYRFICKANELNLGYLFFHRSIPSLSGGELQRLRMVQLFNTQLSNLLLVLDEPLSGLSGNEKKAVYNAIIDLSNKHTIVIVDHSDIFVNKSKQIITLGRKGGINGGFIIDTKKFLAEQNVKKTIDVIPPNKINHIILRSPIYLYNGVDISIGENCLNLIVGSSGVGKSTLLREYFPQYFEKYLYINQKPLLGNKNSSVATALNIFGYLSNLFAKKYKKDKQFFSNQTGCEGSCPACMGAGVVEYATGHNSKIQLKCTECNGTGFNKILEKYKIEGKSIFDIWNMTIDEGVLYFSKLEIKIFNYLNEASLLFPGHLKIGQAISTLSGGENIRVKLLQVMNSTAKVLGIDEPFKGLTRSEIYCVIKYLDQIREKGKTIIVADHSDMIDHYFAKKLELICDNTILKEK